MSGKTRLHWTNGCLGYWLNSGSSAKASIGTTDMQKIDGDNTSNDYASSSTGYDYILINFPVATTITKALVKFSTSMTDLRFIVSTDSTDGIDGSWSTLSTNSYTAYDYTTYNFSSGNTGLKWIKIGQPSLSAYNVYCCHIVGEFEAPTFEFWNSAGNAELDADYPLSLTDASNNADYSANATFKIKNIDNVQHSYSLTIKKAKYGSDPVVTNYFTLSTNGGSTKSTTVTISNLSANTLSGTIGAYADILKANNPADGYHYFIVDVTQTA